MSAHNIRHKLIAAGFADAQEILDPGSGGTVRVEQDKGVLIMTTAGARTFISAARVPVGTEVLVCSTIASASINSLTLNAGEFAKYAVTLDASGDNAWTSLAEIEDLADDVDTAQGDITALEGVVYRTFTDELLPMSFRVHDALGTLLSAGAGSSDDMGVTVGAIGTSRPTLNVTVDDAELTQEGVIDYTIPQTYISGEDLTLTVSFTRTAAADTTATLDAEVYEFSAPSSDICGAASPSGDINSAASGDITFTITGTTLNPGDLLWIRLVAAIDDDAGATAASVWEFSARIAHTAPDQS